MDNTIKYRAILTEYFQSMVQDWTNNSSEEVKMISDKNQNHFLILYYGWSNGSHMHSVPVHIEIKNNKVWIQENMTEIEIDDDLIARGIAKSDIVLGVIPPEYRQYSEFAVA